MRALSLEYHDVGAPGRFDATGFAGAGPNSYKLTAARFDAHLAAIASVASTPPGRVTDSLDRPLSGRPLFITFDDGGVSAIEEIAPAIERHGWRGHFFVTAGRIGSPGFLAPAQIRELHARGHVVGTHSWSHPTMMGACPPEQIFDEWQRSIAALSDLLGEPVLTGSVPGGFYTPAVGDAAARAGLRVLFTSWPTTRCWMVNGCAVLGRYTLRHWSRPRTAAALASGSAAARMTQWTRYRSLHLARRIAGERYTRIRNQYWKAVESGNRVIG